MPLVRALAESLNMATVRLGLDVGLEPISRVLEQLGLEQKPPLYPSMLLGALALTPIEVAQVYNTLANGGFRVPLRAVRSVIGDDGAVLQRYAIEIEQAADPAAVFALNQALVQVMERGTGKTVRSQLPADLTVAGKTGTSDDLRDSWFAGFTNDHLIVAWLGADDNRPIGLTGSSGAATNLGRRDGRARSGVLQRPATRVSREHLDRLPHGRAECGALHRRGPVAAARAHAPRPRFRLRGRRRRHARRAPPPLAARRRGMSGVRRDPGRAADARRRARRSRVPRQSRASARCCAQPSRRLQPAARSAPIRRPPQAASRRMGRSNPTRLLKNQRRARRRGRAATPRARPTELLEQSRAARAAGNYDQASATTERALRIDPNNAALWLELGEIALATGETKQAETLARKALSLAADDRSVTAQAERLLRAAGTR